MVTNHMANRVRTKQQVADILTTALVHSQGWSNIMTPRRAHSTSFSFIDTGFQVPYAS